MPLPVVTAVPAPCAECLAGCCRGFHLVIRGSDAFRIAQEQRLPYADFVELAWCDPTTEGALALDPTEPGHAFRLQLKQIDEVRTGFTEACIFLVTAYGRARCGIYASRPAMCRTYPTGLRGEVLTAEAGPYCPPGSWRLGAEEAREAIALHRFKRRVAAVDDRVAKAWNARVAAGGVRREPDQLLRFFVQVYGALEERMPGWTRAPEPGGARPAGPETTAAAALLAAVEAVLAAC